MPRKESIPIPRPTVNRMRGRSALIVVALLIVGVALWVGFRIPPWMFRAQPIGALIAACACAIPAVRKRLLHVSNRLTDLSPRQVRWMSAGVFVVAFLYLLGTAFEQGRDLFPKWHDQQMTMVQAQMLARGRLWMPRHPCADFFETFYVFVKPVYAAMYFPGAALFFVPTVWLHLPYCLMPLLASAALAALLFRILAEIVDPGAGLIGVILLLSLPIYRMLSVQVMSHTVFALLAAWAVWSWLRWRTSFRLWWAVSLGAALGWAAITRPVDALTYGIPLGAAVLLDLRRCSMREPVGTIVLMVVATLPFLSLQLIQDRGITGRWFRTPVQYYVDVEFPGLSAYGGAGRADVQPSSALPQKRYFGTELVLPLHRSFVSRSFASRFAECAAAVLRVTLPGGALILALTVGLLGLGDRRVLVIAAPIALFLPAYSLYADFLEHYCIAIVPGVLLCAGIGLNGGRIRGHRGAIAACLGFVTIWFALASLPEFHPGIPDDSSWPATWFNYEVLPGKVVKPALVLYRYEPRVYADGTANFNDEPVYNVNAAWPDDAPIIRAHDLGNRDPQIIDYYARIQPNRNVYLVDRDDLKVHFLGPAGELAARLRAGERWSRIVAPL